MRFFKVDIVKFEIEAVTLPPVAKSSVLFTLRSPCGEVFTEEFNSQVSLVGFCVPPS
jgi:hypothetical protein